MDLLPSGQDNGGTGLVYCCDPEPSEMPSHKHDEIALSFLEALQCLLKLRLFLISISTFRYNYRFLLCFKHSGNDKACIRKTYWAKHAAVLCFVPPDLFTQLTDLALIAM